MLRYAASERLFADPILAARLPGGVRHWEGRPIPRFEDLRDAEILAPGDRVVLPGDDPLVRDGSDPNVGVRTVQLLPVAEGAVVSELRLDTEGLERHVTVLRTEPGTNRAVLDLGAKTDVSGVVVEHREAASSFPRGLAARTSEDGATWSDAEALKPRPTVLYWSDEGLMGASFTERTFLFLRPRAARFIELVAEPQHPHFPWIVRRAIVLVRR
jgi:hypothetical protein